MEARNPIVWVMKENTNDYSLAEEYGDVRFITHRELRHRIHMGQNSLVHGDIKLFLNKYDIRKDYIVPTGNPVFMMSVAFQLPVGTHRFLKWNGLVKSYQLYVVTKHPQS